MGCYFGERDWRRRQLATKVVARLSPLDAIDQMTDIGDVENSRQIRMALTTHCAAGLPVHMLRCQRPSLTAYRATQLNAARSQDDQLPTSMAMAVDDRVMHSLASVAEAAQTPLARRSAAMAQMKLPTKLGGAGATAAEPLAAACWVSSLLACWPRMHRWFPIFSQVDITKHEHTMFVELRTAYAELRAQRMRIQRTYDEFKQDLSHYCDRTTVVARFRPTNLISEAAMPPFEMLFDGTSDTSPPRQRQLASIAHHRAWLDTMARCGGCWTLRRRWRRDDGCVSQRA